MKKNIGFSLLELSIVLVIIAISVAGGLLLVSKYSAQSKYDQTQEKMAAIMTAIKKYYLKNSRIPCPANGTLQNSSASFGVGTFSAGSCTTANVSGPVVSGAPAAMGVVPVTTLGIPPSLAVDAWGNRFTYVMVRRAANAALPTADGFYLNVSNYFGNTSGTGAYSEVVVLVMSHGENGWGAWSGRGGGRKDSTGGVTIEDRNALVSATYPYYVTMPYAGTDDIISFWTYRQIINTDLME